MTPFSLCLEKAFRTQTMRLLVVITKTCASQKRRKVCRRRMYWKSLWESLFAGQWSWRLRKHFDWAPRVDCTPPKTSHTCVLFCGHLYLSKPPCCVCVLGVQTILQKKQDPRYKMGGGASTHWHPHGTHTAEHRMCGMEASMLLTLCSKSCDSWSIKFGFCLSSFIARMRFPVFLPKWKNLDKFQEVLFSSSLLFLTQVFCGVEHWQPGLDMFPTGESHRTLGGETSVASYGIILLLCKYTFLTSFRLLKAEITRHFLIWWHFCQKRPEITQNSV